MKKHIVIGLISSIMMFTGCREGELNTKPKNTVDEINTSASSSEVKITANANLTVIEKLIETQFPFNTIILDKQTKDHCKKIYVDMGLFKVTKWLECQYWGGLKKSGSFKLSGSDGTINASLPINFWLSAKMLGIQESTNANVTALFSAKPELDEAWNLKLNADTDFHWDSHPTVELFGIIPVGVQSVLTPQVSKQMKNQADKLASQVEGEISRDKVLELWQKSRIPIKLSDEKNIWLRMDLQEASFSGIKISNNILQTNIGVKADTEIFVGKKPEPLPDKELPKLLKASHEENNFHIALLVEVSYALLNETLNRSLRKGIKWAPIPEQPKIFFTVHNVEIYPSSDLLGIQIDFTADLPSCIFDNTGTVYLTARPMVNNQAGELFVEDVSFTSHTNNRFIDIMGVALRKVIEDKIKNAIRISYKDQRSKLLADVNNNINHDFGNGIVSKGTLRNGDILKIIPGREGVVIYGDMNGALEISYGIN